MKLSFQVLKLPQRKMLVSGAFKKTSQPVMQDIDVHNSDDSDATKFASPSPSPGLKLSLLKRKEPPISRQNSPFREIAYSNLQNSSKLYSPERYAFSRTPMLSPRIAPSNIHQPSLLKHHGTPTYSCMSPRFSPTNSNQQSTPSHNRGSRMSPRFSPTNTFHHSTAVNNFPHHEFSSHASPSENHQKSRYVQNKRYSRHSSSYVNF